MSDVNKNVKENIPKAVNKMAKLEPMFSELWQVNFTASSQSLIKKNKSES